MKTISDLVITGVMLVSLFYSGLAPAQSLTPKLFGVHLRNDHRPLPDNWASLVQNSGSKIVRIPVPWGWFELEGKGKTPAWFWPQLDDQINQARDAGQKVLITFFSTPCWATVAYSRKSCTQSVLGAGSWNFNMPPASATDYATALARIASRYQANAQTRNVVIAYEIWNEPNIITFWANTKRRTVPYEYNDGYRFHVDSASARAYTQLLIAAYQSVKSVNPKLKVIAGGIAGSDTYFLDEMYQAGAKDHFDAISFHPYPDVIQAERHPYYGRAANANDCINLSAIPTAGCFKEAVEAMRSKVLSYGDNKPFWFTEFGISSTPDWGGAGKTGHSVSAAEQAQADEVYKMIHLIKSWDFVETAIWYEFINRPAQDDYASNIWAQVEPYFGLYREDTSSKPVLAAYQNAVNADPLPVQLSPAGQVSSQAYAKEFRWQAVPNASGYVIWLNYLTSPAQNGKINRYVTAAQAGCASGYLCKMADSTVFANNIASTWWVKAFFADGTSRDSRAVNFKLIAPDAPALISPKGNTFATTSAANNAPAFIWKPFPGAVGYKLWVRGYTPFGVDHPDQTGDENSLYQTLTPAQAACTSQSCRYLPGGLSLGYSPSRWAVTAVLAGGKEVVSPPQGFTLYPSRTLFMKPAQIAPEGIITSEKPAYTWAPVAGADRYRLWVNGGNGAGIINQTLPVSVCNARQCSYTPGVAVGRSEGAWWVTALSPAGQEAASDGMSFRVP